MVVIVELEFNISDTPWEAELSLIEIINKDSIYTDIRLPALH